MKLTFKTSLAKKTTFERSSTHITTLDFGRTIISNFLPVILGDTVHIKLNQFMRLAPLAVPTYGDIKLITRAYFVPKRILTPNWLMFNSMTPIGVNPTPMPGVTNKQLVELFYMSTRSGSPVYAQSVSLASGAKADFTLVNPSDFSKKDYILTEKGRTLYQILLGLGYGINWALEDETNFDLLPLLAFLRIAYDIEYPKRYLDHNAWRKIFDLSNYDPSTDFTYIADCVEMATTTFYENDFFCDAWKEFNSADGLNPIQHNDSTTKWTPDPYTGVDVMVDKNGNYIKTKADENGVIKTISSYAHKTLDILTNFALRNNIAGQRYLDFIKAHYGYTTSPENDQFAKFLGSYVQQANIMDVTSTGASQEAGLGELAGKGYINGDGTLTYDVKEEGYIVFTSRIMPSYGYVQGRKPWTIFKRSRLLGYTPELDGVGNDAVRNDLLYADYKNSQDYVNGKDHGGLPNGVFGFAPRYAAEYKIGYDYLTGDFRLNSRNVGLDSFHTFRMLREPRSTEQLKNDITFRQVGNEYDRMFQQSFSGTEQNLYDHFVGYFTFRTKVSSTMKSFSESLPFYEDEAQGREVTMEQQ